MKEQLEDPLADDPRVMEIAREYLAELEAGKAPDRQAYLDRYPELTVELTECLEGIDLLHGAGRRRMTRSLPVDSAPALGTLGDFLLVREIGRGGMGVVYEAIQISLNRMVALKVLPFAAGLDEKQLQRFRNEAQAAAGLHHSHIVPVHAVGCERGMHFYAMQLIDGRSLDAVIREMRSQSSEVTNGDFQTAVTVQASGGLRNQSLTNRGRERFRLAARMAMQIADALEYAHRAGVIHRDIKPGNLLLDYRGIVWVADFGLAQVADVNLTRTGDVVGTLRYMSPEQASGARSVVDHRADVYSLGATLYELLTLQPIFDAQERGPLLRQILEEEPRPLRQLERSIPYELETIVLKAVAKDPADRYDTAAEMAADLERFLSERPILARRPTPAEHTLKWMKRHPSFVGAAVLLLTFSTLVLAVAFTMVSREQAKTRAAYAAERKRAKEAEDRFQLAERAVDDLIQVAQEELLDKPHTENLRKQLLESALRYHQEFIELHKDDPDSQARLGANRDRVEAILNDLTVLQGAGRIFLLKDQAVLDDLNLTEEQQEEIKELNSRLDRTRNATFKEFHRISADERERRFLKMARTNEAAVAEVLSPQQVRRLKQIDLQRQGPDAFRRPDVAATLKLTAAQRSRVRAIIADPIPGKTDEKPLPPWIISDQKKKAAYKQILTLLKSDQTARWKEMIGKEFKGSSPKPPHKWDKPKWPRPPG